MKKIMIIDDEIDILEILERYLSRKYHIETFTNPLDALNALKQDTYHLILSDIMMPQVGGFEIIDELKKKQS